MVDQLRDPRLDNYVGTMDGVAASISSQITEEMISVPSQKEIWEELKPEVKKLFVKALDILKHTTSHIVDWTGAGSIKMWLEAYRGKTAVGVKLSAKERMLYWASVSLTALSWALVWYAEYTKDLDYALIASATYTWAWWFFLVAKSKQLLDGLRTVAEKKNIHSLKALLDRYDAIFAGASQKELEDIDKKIQP